ncbi:hypothetical protein M427DRAFT_54940 [Gonapodya prolifera JEL478]|uniref:BSD domain-containing protein n=1 Tax=Gonapodya prolifera (strain JEL478) TaxID=1344416 RepID=A0A139AJL0_GONPJ|nr:hypothetical protein M427DRAFT_54940 [Gonapodya prolifera JEL478]|eukprot:KXS16898.1 hypothetical protein M427DRAFT_54940 [Gonapodya prolifera JEL478]
MQIGSWFATPELAAVGDRVKSTWSKVAEQVASVSKIVEKEIEDELKSSKQAVPAPAETPETAQVQLPWDHIEPAMRDPLKRQVLLLSQEQRNFTIDPHTAENDAPFDMSAHWPLARAMLVQDPTLSELRFQLVPKVVKEEVFWRNYFYRVGLIQQALAEPYQPTRHRRGLSNPAPAPVPSSLPAASSSPSPTVPSTTTNPAIPPSSTTTPSFPLRIQTVTPYDKSPATSKSPAPPPVDHITAAIESALSGEGWDDELDRELEVGVGEDDVKLHDGWEDELKQMLEQEQPST